MPHTKTTRRRHFLCDNAHPTVSVPQSTITYIPLETGAKCLYTTFLGR